MNGILGSSVLEVAIGMAFLYLLLAVFCTTANEWIAGILSTRSKMLEQAIKHLLAGQAGVPRPAAQAAGASSSGTAVPSTTAPSAPVPDFVTQFYNHPIVANMMRQTGGDLKHFSYLPSRSFATVVMDLVTPHSPGRIAVDDLETGIKNMPDGCVRQALLAAIQNAGNDLQVAQKNIEAWFDDTMSRVSGWYKRFTQKWTVVFALSFAIVLNADTLHMARILWMNPTLRAQVVEQARARGATGATGATGAAALPPVTRDEEKELASFIGWQDGINPTDLKGWALRVVGWALTAIAVSLGAPFWFDTLNRVMNLRNAGKPPDQPAQKTT
jgi:hypothetical protein